MSLPATSLMQSAWHVTAYVHIRFWISKYEYNANDSCNIEYRCHSLLAYWHTLHFVAVNKVDVSNELKLILSKIVNPCLTTSPWIAPLLNDRRSERAPPNINFSEFPSHFLVPTTHKHCCITVLHGRCWEQFSQITPEQWINLELCLDGFSKPVPPLALCSYVLDLPV